jgi:oligoendopeptidase F
MLARKGQVAAMDAAALVDFMQTLSDLQELIGRAASYAGLRFAVDTSDPSNGALMQRVQERATAITTQLIWFELEWAAMDDAAADALLADDRVEPYRYHLQSARRYRSHLLTEPEEKIDAEKDVTGRSAWVRLFSELSAEIKITMPDGTRPRSSAGCR